VNIFFEPQIIMMVMIFCLGRIAGLGGFLKLIYINFNVDSVMPSGVLIL
jgi:hypothetical protein